MAVDTEDVITEANEMSVAEDATEGQEQLFYHPGMGVEEDEFVVDMTESSGATVDCFMSGDTQPSLGRNQALFLVSRIRIQISFGYSLFAG